MSSRILTYFRGEATIKNLGVLNKSSINFIRALQINIHIYLIKLIEQIQ